MFSKDKYYKVLLSEALIDRYFYQLIGEADDRKKRRMQHVDWSFYQLIEACDY